MVNAGMIRAIVVDDYMAEFWSQLLPNVMLHRHIAIREGGDLAMAVRKGSPKLVEFLNGIVRANPPGSLYRNVVLQKYLKSTKAVRRPRRRSSASSRPWPTSSRGTASSTTSITC